MEILYSLIAFFRSWTDKLEEYLNENFRIPSKSAPLEALERWRRKLCRGTVKNARRRFRYTANVNKRLEAAAMRRTNLGKVSVLKKYKPPLVVKGAGFGIDADTLASLVCFRNRKGLEGLGGVEEIARHLNVSLDRGISAIGQTCLPVRQQFFGSNTYDNKPCKSFWTFTWNVLYDITLIICMVCCIVCIVLGIATEGLAEGMYDWLGYILYILLVVMTTATWDYKQYLQFQNLVEQREKTSICVKRDGERQRLPIYDLVVGDVVVLSIGDQVPADGIFISGYDFLVNESNLREESEPVDVNQENPFLFSGAKVQSGSGKMLVTSVGMNTYWSKLMATQSRRGENEILLQEKLNGTATISMKFVLTFSLLTFLMLTTILVVGKALRNEFLEWQRSDALNLLKYSAKAVTIIVVGVPKGVPLAVRLILAFAARELMNKRALLKHLFSFETMGAVGSICINKTATMTTNNMAVDRLWICNQVMSSKDAVAFLKSAKNERVLDLFLLSIFHNYGSQVAQLNDGRKWIFGSPTERALLEFAFDLGGHYVDKCQEIEKLDERPFNSHSKRRSVLVPWHEGRILAFCVGAADIILDGCNKIACIDGEYVHLSDEQRKNILNIKNGFHHGARRTLCFAFKNVADSGDHRIPDDDYTLIAVVGISDPVQSEVKNAVKKLLTAGITLHLVTCDDINSAKAVAKECGMLTNDGLAIDGPEFCSKTIKERELLIPKLQVLGSASPEDKHTLVTELKPGQVVAVIGDGTNDALALHAADVGLAMGLAGKKVAKETADVIILDDNFETIVKLVKWGRAVYTNIQKFVQFQLTANVVAVMFNFASVCISGSAPLTVRQLLWVTLIVDTLGALALATGPPNDGLMNRPPVGRGVSFITKAMWRNIIGQSIYQLAVIGVLNFHGKNLLGLEGSDATEVLNTFIFNTFVFCQVFNEINSRDIEKINIFCGMFNSWIFIPVVLSTVTLQVIIVQFQGILVSSVPLSCQLWLLSILLGLVSMLVAVVFKCILLKQCTPKHYDDYEPLLSGQDDVVA